MAGLKWDKTVAVECIVTLTSPFVKLGIVAPPPQQTTAQMALDRLRNIPRQETA